MREIRTYGSVRGVPGNRHSYRNHDQQYPLVFCNNALLNTTPLSNFMEES
jgi:hypothetical protein